ncbi:MAG: (deoxy)nucleoside triphosphate pyrophosphohydrolase [Liquorilactobacillus hordei]|uniref:(deoxy)nucleoside triphosphate pyrophosphohydrolase n=1 Tax=Liquorilactobacillus hordei TaxID=468911 RepID=UPI0039E8DEB0
MSIEVVCAVILNEKKQMLIGKRRSKSLAGYWEFPGGKVEKNEEVKQALKREVTEEIGAEAAIGPMVVPAYTYQYEFGNVKLHFYFAQLKDEMISPKIYEEYAWLSFSQLASKKWLPANQKVLNGLNQWDLNKVEFNE